MKLRITLKDPDGVYDCIREASESSINEVTGLSVKELEDLVDDRRNELSEKCATWIKYGEYVSIEIDTDNGTAIVLKA